MKKPSSSSKKAAAAAAAMATASGSERHNSGGKHISSGASVGRPSQQSLVAAGAKGDPSKITCTCPHLAAHPDRADLLRNLVDLRIEVNTALILKERNTVGVFGALEGQGMGHPASLCRECDEHTLHEPDDVLTCLECGFTGCGSPPRRHMLRHCLTQPGDGHCFAVSRERGEIFCARCCDYVYDVGFDAAISRTDDSFGLPTEWEHGLNGIAGAGGRGGDACVRGRRRRRARGDGFYSLKGGLAQREPPPPPAEGERAPAQPVLLSPARSRLVAAGVRGMFNLGNTCFMSSVLQAVLHISVMQSFFFGKGHEPARCEKLRKETTRLRSQILQYDSTASFDQAGENGAGQGFGGKRGGGAEKTTIAKKIGDYCIACELARLFHDMFSTEAAAATLSDTEPYVPHRLLEAVWSASEFLAGYEQQDAHEFLIAVLDSLQGHLDRAAREESSAPVLRRTLAAHKQRAKQKKQEAAAEEELKTQQHQHQLPSPPAKKQQKQQQQPQKKAGKQNGGRSGGGSPSLSAAAMPHSAKLTAKAIKAAAAEAAAAAGRTGGKESDAKKNRKRSRSSISVDPGVAGWENQSASSPAGRSNGDRVGGIETVGSPSSPASAHSSSSTGRGGGNKSQPLWPPAVNHDPSRLPWQPPGSGGGGCSDRSAFAQHAHTNGVSAALSSPSNRKSPPFATKNGDINGGETGRREGWNPRGGESEEYGTADGSAARGQAGATAARKGDMLNGQCLEDLNLAGFVQEVFAGVTRSDVVCTACGDVSCTYERFLEVSLPVRAGEQERRQQQEQLERERERERKRQEEEEKKQEAARLLKCADGGETGGGGGVAECVASGNSSCAAPATTTHTKNGGGVAVAVAVAAKAAGVLTVVDDVVTATEIPNGDGGSGSGSGVRVGGASSSSSSSSLSSLSPSVSPIPPVTPVRPSTPAAQPSAPQVRQQQQTAEPPSGRESPAGSCAGGGGGCGGGSKDNDPLSSEVAQATTPSTGRASPASITFSDDSAGRPLGGGAAAGTEEAEASGVRSSPPPKQPPPATAAAAAATLKEGKARSSPSRASPSRASPSRASPSRSSPSPKTNRPGGIGSRRGGGRSRAAAPGPARSITDCFARFAARENLTVRMACDSCAATSVCKTKQMSFCSLPRVLVLHLKRFDAMADRKIDDFVSFPARGLDMGKYLTGWPAAGPTANTGAATASGEPSGDVPAPSLPYDLLAVVNHSGGMAQGHYTAYVKEIGRWFRFDDTWVHEVDEKEVLASEAYILFYFQRGADAAWRPPAAEAPSPAAAATGKRRLSVP
eukprot:g11461.t1